LNELIKAWLQKRENKNGETKAKEREESFLKNIFYLNKLFIRYSAIILLVFLRFILIILRGFFLFCLRQEGTDFPFS
jgi:hypothetical protein